MSKLRLIVSPNPRHLLEQAADGFLTRGVSTPDRPFPTPDYLLVLRQGGLRDELIALATGRGVPGWFDPPLALFHELPDWLGATDRRPCTDFERAVILGGVLRGLGGEVFGRKLQRPEDFLGAIDRLAGELVSEGVTPAAFRAALEARTGRDAFERNRDHELADIYAEYIAALEKHGRRDGRDTMLDCAAALAADADGFVRRMRGRREIRIVGLNDLRGGWRKLLSALEASPAIDRIVIYSAEQLELDAAVETLAAEPADRTVARAIIAAPDPERELEEVARRIRALADAGTPLGDIAIVARQARPCVDLALTALARFGVPASARRRVGLREIPVVRAVRSLFAAAADGWSRHALAELAEQPYFASELDARIINSAGFRQRIVGLDAWERSLPGLATFAARARALDQSRPLREWVDWLEEFLTLDPWQIRDRINVVPGGRFDVTRLDLAGWRSLTQIVASWRESLDTWGGADDRIDAAGFYTQLAELLEGDAALWTPVFTGVQVLEAFAGAYRSFEHLFVVGLGAGRFPLRAPSSPLLDEGERKELAALGLPFEPRETWEARERELFRVLDAGARESSTLSYSRLDGSGREAVRSALVDAAAEAHGIKEVEISAGQVLIEGARRYVGLEAPVRARHALRIERDRHSGVLSPYNGLIEDPELRAWLAEEFGDERLWSPTQLESFAKCPWSYFSARLLRIARLDDPDEEMDSATRGTVLHDALRRFYEMAQTRTPGPVLLRDTDMEWASGAVVQALDEALADAGGRIWLGHSALQAPKREELRRMLVRYLAFEAEHNEKMFNNRTKNAKLVRTGVVEHELAFDGMLLERGGVKFRFRGSIDRVEEGIDERVPSRHFVAAVDYKTSKYSAPGGGSKEKGAPWDDGVVLQVPLYAYALSQLKPEHEVARVEYRAIRQRETVHSLELYQVDPKTKALQANAEAKERLEDALDRVAEHVLRARGGEFPAAPAASCGCPDFCHALEICRVAGGPRLKGW